MENTNIFRATQDPFIDDPREDFDAVVTVVKAGYPTIYCDPLESDDGATRAYAHAIDLGRSEDTALAIANRYSRVYGDGTPVTMTHATGYAQGDWWNILAMGPEAEAAVDLFTYYLRGTCMT